MNITPPVLKELITLMDQGKQPIIEFINDEMEELFDFSKGMKTRCISYIDDSVGDEADDLVIILNTDFSEFEELNKLVSPPIWIGAHGKVKWHESTCYPKDKKSKVWLGNDADKHIKLAENPSPHYIRYKSVGSNLGYIEWLERELDNFC